jgi:undecaprenyl-diphosphatase
MAVCAWAFVKLANKIRRGHSDEIDNHLLRAFWRQTNLAIPIGPTWSPNVAKDVTGVRSGTNLLLSSTILVGFLCLNGRFRAAGFVIAAPRKRFVDVPVA